jgi:hypothetical protein
MMFGLYGKFSGGVHYFVVYVTTFAEGNQEDIAHKGSSLAFETNLPR